MPIEPGDWFRTCQECGHQQKAKQPKPGELTNSYANSKCRKCGSEALDYGTTKAHPRKCESCEQEKPVNEDGLCKDCFSVMQESTGVDKTWKPGW